MMSEDRIARLEAGQEALQSNVVQLGKTIEGHAAQTRHAIESLAKQVSDGQRTPWSALASWAAVILVIVGMAGSGYVRDLDRTDAEIKRLRERQARSDVSDTEQHERIRALERASFGG